MSDEKPKTNMIEMIFVFMMPTVVSKMAVVYFGAYYSAYPGEGYGIGLVIAILFTIISMARFLWKYRHHKD